MNYCKLSGVVSIPNTEEMAYIQTNNRLTNIQTELESNISENYSTITNGLPQLCISYP